MTSGDQIQAVAERLRQAAPDATIILFGSHARGDAREGSDLDFLVEFNPSSPREHKEAFFELMEGLKQLFSRQVDLVELVAVRNPYVKSHIEQDLETVYDAA